MSRLLVTKSGRRSEKKQQLTPVVGGPPKVAPPLSWRRLMAAFIIVDGEASNITKTYGNGY